MTMDNVVPLHRDAHHEALLLMPWYVTGALEGDERSRLEAHLEACAECRDALAFERRLASETAALPADASGVEAAWAAVRQRLDAPARSRSRPRSAPSWRGRATHLARAAAPWIGWAVAAQFVLALGVRALMPSMLAPQPAVSGATYHALAASQAPVAADVAVIFRPEARVADIRRLLLASHARLTDGPTAAGVWLLSVPPTERAEALARLRGDAGVERAEALDPATGP